MQIYLQHLHAKSLYANLSAAFTSKTICSIYMQIYLQHLHAKSLYANLSATFICKSICNIYMQDLSATFTCKIFICKSICNIYMQIYLQHLHARSTCNIYMQNLNAAFTCKIYLHAKSRLSEKHTSKASQNSSK